MSCIFCEILKGNQPSSMVFQDDLCSAFMDIQPVNAGHLLVVPNQHAGSLAELEERTGGHIFQVAQRLAHALRQSGIRCEGINFYLADGEVAGQEVDHVHLHVFPRYRGDGFGIRVGLKYHIKPSRADLNQYAQKIKSML